jgi:hypothetical protein
MKIFIGIVCILIGVLVIYIHYKSPKTDFTEGEITSNVRGYGSGLFLLAIGIHQIISFFNE